MADVCPSCGFPCAFLPLAGSLSACVRRSFRLRGVSVPPPPVLCSLLLSIRSAQGTVPFGCCLSRAVRGKMFVQRTAGGPGRVLSCRRTERPVGAEGAGGQVQGAGRSGCRSQARSILRGTGSCRGQGRSSAPSGFRVAILGIMTGSARAQEALNHSLPSGDFCPSRGLRGYSE